MMSERGNSPLNSRTVPGGWVPVITIAPDASLTSIHESAGNRMTRGLSGTPAPPEAPAARGTTTAAGQGGGVAEVEADAVPCAATGTAGAATLGADEADCGFADC